MTAHLQDDDRHRQRHGRSRSAGVMSRSSGLGPASAVTVTGSSAMPQIGQAPGPVLADLRMHRAGVDRALGNRRRARLPPGRGIRRLGDEALAAARRTEIVGPAGMLGAMLGGMRVDAHAADRVLRRCAPARGAVGMMVAVIVVVHVGSSAGIRIGNTVGGYRLTPIPGGGMCQPCRAKPKRRC